MSAHDEDRIQGQLEARIKQLLQRAIPPIDAGAEPARDLWPVMLRHLDAAPGTSSRLLPHSLPWFDWALIAGLVLFAAFFPATIPVFLYYL